MPSMLINSPWGQASLLLVGDIFAIIPDGGLIGKLVIGGILGLGALLWFRSKLRQAEEEKQKRIERDLYIIGLMRAHKAQKEALDAAKNHSSSANLDDPTRW